MPERDLQALTAEFLIENVDLACRVREAVPWGRDLPDEIFLNEVLPYANLNERRDRWRADFRDRFLDTALECGSIKETVKRLNHHVFFSLDVKYHATKRPKPDQSPQETMEVHYASCTGLSILIADALRAVGVPARVAGTPLWVNESGNHTWVEVWDGAWHHIEANASLEYAQAWFNGIAAQADPEDPEHRIYAASFKRTGLVFPLVWDRTIDYVHAVDVTGRYVEEAETREGAGGSTPPSE